MLTPTEGCCRIFGHTAGSDAARAQVGFLPDSLHFPPGHSAREILSYYAALSSMQANTMAGWINAVLEWAGLKAVADQKVGTFSKGMRHRLGLAATIVHEPQVVLLDEPASGLDPEGRIALDFLAEGLGAHPDDPVVLIEMANIRLRVLNDREGGARLFRQAAGQPDAPYYPARIYAELLTELGRPDEALEWLKQILPGLPADDRAARREVVAQRIKALEAQSGAR